MFLVDYIIIFTSGFQSIFTFLRFRKTVRESAFVIVRLPELIGTNLISMLGFLQKKNWAIFFFSKIGETHNIISIFQWFLK